MDEPTCSVDGCDKPPKALGWCSAHYERWRLTGDIQANVPLKVLARPRPPGTQCAVDGCERTLEKGGRGWCGMHHTRWRKYGDPLAVKMIIGDDRTRIESHIDRSGGPDACHPWTAGKVPSGYGWVKVGKTSKLAHMAVWELENGPKPPEMDLDHECHNLAVAEGRCVPGICAHRLCCNLRHIALKSRAEHVSIAKPWQYTPRRLGNRKLTEAQVGEMRSLLASGKTAREMAERYGLSRVQVYRIKSGKAWGDAA